MDYKTILERTILECYVGSFAYGTNLPSSDKDESGVCIPTKEYFIGSLKFEQANKWIDENGNKIDKNIYGINKALDLILDANPNMVDLLYIPERCIKKITPEWERILEIRNEFISKKVRHSYAGYSYAQMERIQTHRSYLLHPVKEPNREEYNLPKKSVFPETQYQQIARLAADWIPYDKREEFYREFSKVIDNEAVTIFRKYVEPHLIPMVMGQFKQGQKEFLHMISSISGMFLKEEYTEHAINELRYLSAWQNWKRYKEWEQNRNPERKQTEAKSGFDTKHASHAVRLSRMCVEILEGKGVLVDRTDLDAEELVAVRLGEKSYEWILEETKKLDEKAKELYETSSLPYHPNRKLVNEIRMNIIEKYLWQKAVHIDPHSPNINLYDFYESIN